jgi:hypothetical protein
MSKFEIGDLIVLKVDTVGFGYGIIIEVDCRHKAYPNELFNRVKFMGSSGVLFATNEEADFITKGFCE